ncbi:MAG: tRNA pseudouridine(38-40) synthase TruA [Desulfobacteraceae bacterium]|nr:tRNA pseudouridine(38-40) synthase TruA [Desulfobacteraceae bacterium]
MTNVKLTIEYDGSAYHGWQVQRDDRTVQQTIESALFKITKHPVKLIGSGRTDAGVHARGQVANFKCESRLTPEIFQKALNSLLPEDMVIKNCAIVPDTFHSRYDVKRKCYGYYIHTGPLPPVIGRQYVWHVRRQLDMARMNKAADYLVGRYDFKSFEAAGSPRSHTIRNIYAAEWSISSENILKFHIEADGFLRFMVRNIVGTLVDVGSGRIDPSEMKTILQAADRSRAGATAPAHGLFLEQVRY